MPRGCLVGPQNDTRPRDRLEESLLQPTGYVLSHTPGTYGITTRERRHPTGFMEEIWGRCRGR